MNWEAVAAISEMAGAIGVIASLAYLAVQVRTNSEDVRNNTTLTVVQMLVEARRDLTHTSLVEVIAKLGAGEELTAQDRILYNGYLQHLANVFDVAHLAIRRGKVEASFVPGLENRMTALAKAPLFEDFWVRNGVDYSEDFQSFVRSVRGG